MVAKVLQKTAYFSEICTLIAEFKLQIAIQFTMEPNKNTTKMGLEPKRAIPDELTVRRLNHPTIFSILGSNKLSFCM